MTLQFDKRSVTTGWWQSCIDNWLITLLYDNSNWFYLFYLDAESYLAINHLSLTPILPLQSSRRSRLHHDIPPFFSGLLQSFHILSGLSNTHQQPTWQNLLRNSVKVTRYRIRRWEFIFLIRKKRIKKRNHAFDQEKKEENKTFSKKKRMQTRKKTSVKILLSFLNSHLRLAGAINP